VSQVSYVCGFLFTDPDAAQSHLLQVLLIRKLRPAWQKGYLNGIGGKIEPGETPLEAMNREFEEEAGISGLNWKNDAILTLPNAIIHFFSSHQGHYNLNSAKQQTDEPLVERYVYDLCSDITVSSVPLIIQIALDTSGIIKPVMLTSDTSFN